MAAISSAADKLPLPAAAGGQCVGSATPAGMAAAAAATAVLPPHAIAVAIKTPAATSMVGAKTTRKHIGSVGAAVSLSATAAAWQ